MTRSELFEPQQPVSWRLQRCNECGVHQFYPRPFCLACDATSLDTVLPSGRGSIVSFTVVHRSPLKDRFQAPYTLTLVQLEEGPTVLSHLADPDEGALACGAAVVAEDRIFADGVQLPVFLLARD